MKVTNGAKTQSEEVDLENPDKYMKLAIKKENRNSHQKNKEDKLLDAATRNLLEMELILLDDEEPILIEEKTKQEEKGVSQKD